MSFVSSQLGNCTSSSGEIKISLLAGEQVITQHSAQGDSGPLSGVFCRPLARPGHLHAASNRYGSAASSVTAQRQVIVAPDPFGW